MAFFLTNISPGPASCDIKPGGYPLADDHDEMADSADGDDPVPFAAPGGTPP